MIQFDPNEPISDRLKIWMDANKLNALKLSVALGYKSSEKISRLFRDDKPNPSIEIILDLMKSYKQFPLKWVLTGKGEMMHTEKELKVFELEDTIEKLKLENEFATEYVKKLQAEIVSLKRRLEELQLKPKFVTTK